MSCKTLSENALKILMTANPYRKCYFTLKAFNQWQNDQIPEIGESICIEHPRRPNKPTILLPKFMPRRRGLNKKNTRIALLHSLAHVELNAIDLAWDIIARFNNYNLPLSFYNDWVDIAKDEAIHFLMLSKRLKELGSKYGHLEAHGGLWDAAKKTSHNLIYRLAIVPMYFEARGLDVSPKMIEKLKNVKDEKSAKCLKKIYFDEISHVKIGEYWFRWICEKNELNPQETWKNSINKFFRKKIPVPENNFGRKKANMSIYLS